MTSLILHYIQVAACIEVKAVVLNFSADRDDAGDYSWVILADDNRKRFTPVSVIQNTITWKDIPSGKYRLVFDLHEESWSGMAHVVKFFEVNKSNKTIEFEFPKKNLKCSLDYGAHPTPNWGRKTQFMRVQRYLPGGDLDPIHVQWLRVTDAGGRFQTGLIEYCMVGKYRIVSLKITPDGETVDYLEGDLEVDDQILASGKAEVSLRTLTRHPGTAKKP